MKVWRSLAGTGQDCRDPAESWESSIWCSWRDVAVRRSRRWLWWRRHEAQERLGQAPVKAKKCRWSEEHILLGTISWEPILSEEKCFENHFMNAVKIISWMLWERWTHDYSLQEDHMEFSFVTTWWPDGYCLPTSFLQLDILDSQYLQCSVVCFIPCTFNIESALMSELFLRYGWVNMLCNGQMHFFSPHMMRFKPVYCTTKAAWVMGNRIQAGPSAKHAFETAIIEPMHINLWQLKSLVTLGKILSALRVITSALQAFGVHKHTTLKAMLILLGWVCIKSLWHSKVCVRVCWLSRSKNWPASFVWIVCSCPQSQAHTCHKSLKSWTVALNDLLWYISIDKLLCKQASWLVSFQWLLFINKNNADWRRASLAWDSFWNASQ